MKGLQPLKYRYPRLLKDVANIDYSELVKYCRFLNVNLGRILNISKIDKDEWPYRGQIPLYSVKCTVYGNDLKEKEYNIFCTNSKGNKKFQGYTKAATSKFSDKNLEKL